MRLIDIENWNPNKRFQVRRWLLTFHPLRLIGLEFAASCLHHAYDPAKAVRPLDIHIR